MFRDEATVMVKAGRGGDGCVSFRHEAFAPKGGPDGGDGGRGGDVWFVASRHESSLLDIVRLNTVKGQPGDRGGGTNSFGKNGDDARILVPVGTLFFDAATGEQLADMTKDGQEWRAARGGRGGRGNKSFATATHQVPRDYEYGEDGEEKLLRLELKLIADVGIAGLPNAGKSTLLSRVSAAKPKIGSYPFTTLVPKLGIVESGDARFTMADIPGLIEGASEGKGLGHQFLRHIERCRVLVHLIDMSGGEVEELQASYKTIRHELESFSPVVASKREIVVGNKIDVTEARERVGPLSRALGVKVIGISGVTGEGIGTMLSAVVKVLEETKPAVPVEDTTDAPGDLGALAEFDPAVPAERIGGVKKPKHRNKPGQRGKKRTGARMAYKPWPNEE